MRGGRGDFLPPPLVPRREPMPPMPSIGMRGPMAGSMGSNMRDGGSFGRGTSDYGMFSRRSPPANSNMQGSMRSRMYEDFSRDTFDERRLVGY